MIFENVAIESVSYVLPPHVITSEDLERQIDETMKRLRVPLGRINYLAGINERRFWDPGVQPSEVATLAARKAIEEAGIDPERLGVLVNTSVSRDYEEPSTACLVHGNLGLGAHCMNYDIGNACLGFVNGMYAVGMMIETGQIDYGIVVNAESARHAVEGTVRRLQQPETTMETFRDNFATLTLGSGAVAMVLTHKKHSRTTHRVNGMVNVAATKYNRLCLGKGDEMITDASALLLAGVDVVSQAWKIASEELPNWSDDKIDLYAPHQVGSRHVAAVVKAIGATPEKFFLNFPVLGNIGPAAMPISLAQAAEQGRLSDGSHVALIGVGSGINCCLVSVTW